MAEQREQTSHHGADLPEFVANFLKEKPPLPGFDERARYWARQVEAVLDLYLNGGITKKELCDLTGGVIAIKESREESDFLTGLGNRRVYVEDLRDRINESRRQESPLSVAALDHDNFKILNDTRGHPVGDKFLIRVGEIIRSYRNRGVLGYRTGGDEMAFILPNCSLQEAAVLINSLEEEIKKLIAGDPQFSGLEKPLGLSVGIVQWDGIESTEDLEKRADNELYRTKGIKKNG